jgi:hypothetical protein
MKTFIQFQEGIFGDLKARFKKKKPATGIRPYRTGKNKDSAAYRTDHHYGHGDIEPSDIPVFKPTWQNR